MSTDNSPEYYEGMSAWEDDIPPHANPYPEDTQANKDWYRGWYDMNAEGK